MALRVLLADESTTIKKVMQLALQDYGVDVKAVAIGLDVVSVAKAYKPDIFFVDVLLQKRSGYDVVRDLKANFAGVPVVLMWSGFMELDEAKAAACGADRRLEKPFDAEALRHLVKDLVPKTQGNVISDYLTFPSLPEFEEAPSTGLTNTAIKAPQAEPAGYGDAGMPAAAAPTDIYAIPEIGENDLDAIPVADPAPRFDAPETAAYGGTVPEDFGGDGATGAFIATPEPLAAAPAAATEESWSHQDLSKFKVDLSEDGEGAEEFAVARIQSEGEFEEVTFTSPKTAPAAMQAAQGTGKPATPPPKPVGRPGVAAATTKATGSAMDEVMAEKILREEARAILERVVWQVLPDIAERVVREELQRLMKDAERG